MNFSAQVAHGKRLRNTIGLYLIRAISAEFGRLATGCAIEWQTDVVVQRLAV